MKKLSLVLVMMFAVGWVMAQQVSTVGQNGTGNTATVTQTGADGNTSNINIAGNTNTATVSQLNGGFAGDHHDAEILITGNSNVASIDQQLQANGDAKITQIGNGNTANVIENGNLYATHPDSPGYDAWANQVGNSNTIAMSIFGTNAAAFAEQLGNGNYISQTLGEAVGEKVENSTVYAKQVGNNNTALQYTEGQGFAGGITAIGEVERIEQTGNANWASQRQYDDLLPAQNNYAFARQLNDNNASIQNQAGQSNQAFHYQNGNDNATTVQIGANNLTTVNQF